MKLINNQNNWDIVGLELEKEQIKLQSYDNSIIELMGNIENKNILDFGSGPGILASILKKKGSNIFTYDISKEFNKISAQKLGEEFVFFNEEFINEDYFDIVICNLVLCIVDELEVANIFSSINRYLKTGAKAYFGFCNPLIFNITESQLDFRPKPLHNYNVIHSYFKTKKEGNYKIIENHRPIKWYEELFSKFGLELIKRHFTPTYSLNGNTISDFIIFEVNKK